MKINIPVEKNKDYIIKITGMGHEGEGVGKVDNFTVFVQGAILGEEVEVKIIKVSKNFAVGKLLSIINPSKDRVEPICSIYKRCGGCQLQHLNYEGQLAFKKDRVTNSIARIGGLKIKNYVDNSSESLLKEDLDDNLAERNYEKEENSIEIKDVIGMTNPYKYRNKVQLPVGEENGIAKIGFYSPRSHNIVDMDNCFIQHEIGDKVVKITREWLNNHKELPYKEENHSGIIKHIMIRKAFKTGEVMVVLVVKTREVPYINEFIENIKVHIKDVVSIVENINKKETNTILGQESIVLWGKDSIEDYIGQFKFKISPLSFFQVNPVQTEVLYNKALEYAALTGNEIVFDAYCGTGTISLFLSQNAKKVYGVEIVPQAIENAKTNAKENGIENVEFIVGESEKVIPELINKGVKADVVVVDPPRKGCEKELLEAIAKMQPKRVVYVSCDPGTLARDLGILDKLGYKAEEIQPVDMFPHTAHVESVVLITRKDR